RECSKEWGFDHLESKTAVSWRRWNQPDGSTLLETSASSQPISQRNGAVRKSRRWHVSKYLVVANQTLGGDHLMDEVRRRAAAGPSSFYVIVPNTHSVDAARGSGTPVALAAMSASTEEEDHRASLIAQSRLHQ